MMKKTWLGLVCASSLLLVSTGCEEECTDAADCRDEGSNFVCVDGECRAGQPTPQDAGTDAGATDAGEEEDAGVTDAGVEDAGVTDAGVEECSEANPTCEGTNHCDRAGITDGGVGTCRPLWIGVTESVDAGAGLPQVGRATIVQYNSTGMRTLLGGGAAITRYPRWSGDGNAVVYVQAPGVASMDPTALMRHELAGGTDTLVIDAPDAGTNDFVQLEYAPSDKILWTKVSGTMNSRSGVQWLPGTGGTLQQLSMGGYADWFPDGDRFAFANVGIKVYDTTSGGTTSLTNVNDEIMPEVSRDGSLVLFMKSQGNYVEDLYAVPASGGTAQVVEASVAPVGNAADGGTPGSFTSNPTWGENNTAVYVRVNFFNNAMGGQQICEPTDPICGGKGGQQIVFQPIGATGAPTGTPVVATVGVLPSVSPDGQWLAYVIRGATGNSELRVVPVDENGNITGAGFTHAFPQLLTGDESARPRWQPK